MVIVAAGSWSIPAAEAREAPASRLDIDASTLPGAIAELAREAGVSIGTPGELPRIRTPRVHGASGVAEALARLLVGSGYRARQISETAWRIEPAPQAAPPSPPTASAPHDEPPPSPIIVTATKQALELASLPASASVVDLASPQRQNGATGTAMVADRIEGLALTSLGAGRNRLFLRGVADSAFGGESQSTVAIVLDEARLTYSAPDPDIRLVDMDRVEVLKGPQGSLYGSGALGGIYRMVTHAPEAGAFSLSASASVMMRAHGDVGPGGTLVANVPLAGPAATLRLVGYHSVEPGWIDTGERQDGNGTRVTGVRAILRLEPANGWRADLTAFGQWLASHDSGYVYDRRTLTRPGQQPEPHDNDLSHIASRVTGGIGSIDVTLATAMTWHEVHDTLDATIGGENLGLPDPLTVEDRRRFRVWDSDLRLNGRWGDVEWLAGLTHLDASQRVRARAQARSGETLVFDADARDSHETSAYFNVTVPLARTLSIDAGARLFHSSGREERTLAIGRVKREQDKAGVTPSLALAWQPRPDRLIYLRYGSAYRQGGLDISASGAIDVLKSDELASIEGGWRERLAGGGHVEINAFFSRWENVQSDNLRADGRIETVTAGDARIIGLEASLDVPLQSAWHLEAGGDFSSALLTRNALGIRLEDRRLPVVPRYTLRGALRYRTTLGSAEASARLGLRYAGPARMSFDPLLDRKMGDVLDTTLELHLTRGPWDFALDASNLLDGRADTFAYGNPYRYVTMDQFTPQRPRTLMLTASYQW